MGHEPQPFDVEGAKAALKLAEDTDRKWSFLETRLYASLNWTVAKIERLRAENRSLRTELWDAVRERGLPTPPEGNGSDDSRLLYAVLFGLNERDQLRQQLAERDKVLDAGREELRIAWREFNAIRARDGAPTGVSHEWWDQITERMREILGDEAQPWPCAAARLRDQELAALRERAEKAEQDAERYRWLREGNEMEPTVFFETIPDTDERLLVAGETLDKAIDAARGA